MPTALSGVWALAQTRATLTNPATTIGWASCKLALTGGLPLGILRTSLRSRQTITSGKNQTTTTRNIFKAIWGFCLLRHCLCCLRRGELRPRARMLIRGRARGRGPTQARLTTGVAWVWGRPVTNRWVLTPTRRPTMRMHLRLLRRRLPTAKQAPKMLPATPALWPAAVP